MSFQYSVAVRNALAGQFEATIGTSPTLEIRTGAPPATCATADSGTVLLSMTLPSDWLGTASSGVVSLAGIWSDPVADATGTAGHIRIKQGGTCHMQGTVSQSEADGGTGDIKLAQATAGIVAGQPVTISAFTITIGGA